MTERERIEKRAQIMDLLPMVDCYEVDRFFDVDSDEMLDEKIKVLTALKDGKTISEIPDFYDVLELYPQNDIWD